MLTCLTGKPERGIKSLDALTVERLNEIIVEQAGRITFDFPVFFENFEEWATNNAIQPAPSDAASSPQLLVTPNDATCLDYEELNFQYLYARSDSTLNIFNAFLYHGILAPTKTSRDSNLQVASALKLIRSIHDNNPVTNQLLITRKITSRDYEQLVAQVTKD
jgi:hypothetical protein